VTGLHQLGGPVVVTIVAGRFVTTELIAMPPATCRIAHDHWMPRLVVRQSISLVSLVSRYVRVAPRGGEGTASVRSRDAFRAARAATSVEQPVRGRPAVLCSVPACGLLAAVVVAEEGDATWRAQPPTRDGLRVEIAGEEQPAAAALSRDGRSHGHDVHGTRFLSRQCTRFLDLCN